MIFLIAVSSIPTQFVFADDIWDIIEKRVKVIVETLSDEELIRHALTISEKYGLQIAHTIGYDFSESYFDNYQDVDVKNLTFEYILLSVIQSYNVQQYSDILIENPFLREFEIEKNIQNFENDKDDVRDKYHILGTYDKDAWNILETSSKQIIIAKYTDQSNIDALNKPRSADEEVAIMIIQAIPAYDPKTGQLVTLKQATNELIQDIPALDGTDIEKDPIRSGVLLVTEPDYMMQAKLIQTQNGHTISLQEALLYDYKNEDVRKAQQILEIIDDVMDLKKIDHPDKKAQQFTDLIKKINAEKENLSK